MGGDDCDVLVVGAGPSGLTAATELARRGIAVRIVDAAAGPNTETRALGMQARTLELFEKQDVVDALLARGLRAHRFTVFSEHRQILRVEFDGLDSPYPFLLMIPQNETQDVLADRLSADGVEVERQVELVRLSQDPDGVDVVLRRADDTLEHTRARWLVGADGAHSTVRHRLGLEFLGTSFEENFAVADLRMDWSLPHDQFFAFLDRGRFVAYFPMLHGWHRIAIAQPGGRPGAADVTLDELQEAVDVCAPPGARIVEVRQSGRFRINQRRVESHSRGRVFLVGDAAHIHSVVGAQGMNTGIQDAFNLGWKMAAVVRGLAAPALLDTYAAERAPVADRLVKATRRVTTMTLLSNPLTTGLRRTLAPHVLARRHVQRALTRAISQIDVSYHDHHGAAPDGRVEAGDRAPDFVFDAPNAEATRIFDLLDRQKFTLICFGAPGRSPDRAVEGYEDVVRVVRIDEPSAAVRYGLHDTGLVLVRPDGYIACRSGGTETTAVRRCLGRFFAEGEETVPQTGVRPSGVVSNDRTAR